MPYGFGLAVNDLRIFFIFWRTVPLSTDPPFCLNRRARV